MKAGEIDPPSAMRRGFSLAPRCRFLAPTANALNQLFGSADIENLYVAQDLDLVNVLESGLQGDINYEDTDATRQGRAAGYYRAVQK